MLFKSLAGSIYFVTFIDDRSRFTGIYFLKKKSEVFEKSVVADVEHVAFS